MYSGGIARGADAMRRRRDVYGVTLRFALGDTIQRDNAGGLIVKNSFGKIVKTINRFEEETRFYWNKDGQLGRVDLPEGNSFARLEDGNWIRVHPDQIIEKSEKEFAVMPDGTLRTTCRTTHGTKYLRETLLDGTTTVINEHGRITAVQADLAVQTERLYCLLDNLHRARLINFDQRQIVCDAYYAVLRRIALEEISEERGAQLLFHICRLLESCSTSPLGARHCFILAQDIMYYSGNPDDTDNSDGLSMLIRELYRLHPEQVANLIADMSVSKTYATMSGIVVSYVDELMHPTVRRLREWNSAVVDKRFVEANRFLRVVLVNIVHKARLERRPANAEETRRSLSTREFGKVKQRELVELYEQVTGFSGAAANFKSPYETDVLERSIPFVKGHNSSSEVA